MISFLVSAELIQPEIDVCFRRGSSRTAMPMPKAPVDEDSLAKPREHQVWAARKVSPMKPETVPHRVGDLPYDHFWSRVLGSNTGHHCGPLFFCVDVQATRNPSRWLLAGRCLDLTHTGIVSLIRVARAHCRPGSKPLRAARKMNLKAAC